MKNKDSFSSLTRNYNEFKTNGYNNITKPLSEKGNHAMIRKVDSLLQAPAYTDISTKSQMLNNATVGYGAMDFGGMHVDYTTSSYYILEKAFRDNNLVKHICRTYANACVKCEPQFSFESEKSTRNTNYLKNLTDILSFPNKNESWAQLVRKTYIALVLFGDAYWQVRPKANGEIYGIYFVPPQSIRPVPYIDANDGDLKFVYAQLASSNNIKFDVSKVFTDTEIIHFKTDNPFSALYGLSEFRPLFKNLEFDVTTKVYLNNFFENSFSGGMIFEIKDTNQDVVERNKEELIELLSGAENAGRNMILEGNVRLVHDGNKTKEFPLQALMDSNADKVYTGTGVTLAMAGGRSENGKLNSELVESEEQIFLTNVETYQSILFDTLNNSFLRNILNKKDVKIVAGVNKHFSLKRAESMVETALKVGATINELRKILGLPKLDDSSIGELLIVGTNNGAIPMEVFFKNIEIDSETKIASLEQIKKQTEQMGLQVVDNINSLPSKKKKNEETKQPSLKVSNKGIEVS